MPPRHARQSSVNRGKLLATVLALGGAATVAGLGTFGQFTSTTSANASVSSGTVEISLGTAGTAANRLTVAATGIVPGDTVQRAVDLSVAGSEDLSAVSLDVSAPTSSVLDTDTTDGLQLTVDACDSAWTESGTAPAYTYTCPGGAATLVASRPVVGSGLSLAGVGLTTGSTSHLRVTLALPTSAGNAFQGKSSVLTFAFTGVQRAGADR
jgi:spore coat-associated protein N